MTSHRRSLSEGLVLEDSDRAYARIYGINSNKGDETFGAVKNDAIDILKLIDPSTGKIQMPGMRSSKSLVNLDKIKAPDELRKDSYNKLFNAKVKRFMKGTTQGKSQEDISHSLTGQLKLGRTDDEDDFIVSDGDTDTSGKLRIPKVGLSSHLLKGGVDDQDINMTFPEADLKRPKLNGTSIANTTGEFKMPNVKMPKINPSGLKGPDVEGDFERSDLSWPSHKFDADVDVPDVDIYDPTRKLKMPKMKTPKFNLFSFKGPDVDVNGDMERPFDINGPKTNLRGELFPDMDEPAGQMKIPKIKMPDFGHSISNVKAPDMDLSLPKMKGQINPPNLTALDLDINVPTGTINGPTINKPKFDLRTPQFNIDAPSGNLQMPSFNDPKIKGEMGSPDMSLSFPGADVKGPNLDVNSPDINIDDASGKFKMPKMKTPKFSLPGFKGPDVDVNGDFERPDLSWSSPKFDADVGAPNVDIDGPTGKLKMPKMKTPKFSIPGFKGPDVDVKGDFERPDLSWSSPKFDADVGAPNVDIDGPTGKLKMPKMKTTKFSLPGFKGPDVDVNGDFERPDLSWSSPKFDADVDAPNIDIDGPTGKLKMPKMKTPKFSLPGFKGPDVDVNGDFERPDLSWSSPKFDADVGAPNVDIDGPTGKLKMPKMKTPKFSIPGFKGPHIDAEGDLKGPDLNMSSKFDADFTAPNLNIDGPRGTLKGITLPNMDLPSGKIKTPKLPGLGLSGSKVQAPEMDLSLPKMKGGLNIGTPSGNLNSPNLKGPKFEADISSPDMNLAFPEANMKGPKLDMKSPDIDIEGPKGKLKMPKMKAPKFSLPGFKGPDIDVKGGLKGPDLSMTSPKMPRFTLPRFGLSGPKIKSSEMDLSLPKMKGEINSPNLTAPDLDVNVPTGKIKGPTLKEPKFDIRSPEFNINAPSGKIKTPKMKTPKFSIPGFSGPGLDVKGDLKSPDFGMSSPKFDANFTAPDLDIDGPKADVKGMTLPNLHLPSGKTPKFEMPSFGLSGPKPEMDLSLPKLKAPKLSGPELDVNVPTTKIKGPNLKNPKIDIRKPEFSVGAPSGNLKMPTLNGPKIRGEMDSPDMNLAFPKADVKGPKVEMNSPDFNIDSPTGKLKMPKIKAPKFSIPGFKGPDLNISSPKFDADITRPDLYEPKANVKGMTLPNLHLPSGKTKTSKFRLPDLELSGPKVKAPDVDLSLPKMEGELNPPKLTVPDLDVDVPTGKIKGLKLKEPNIDFRAPDFNINTPSGELKMPNVKEPNLKGEISSPDMNSSFPKADFKVPKLDVNSPGFDIDGPTGKLKMPKIKTPKFSIPGFKGPDIDAKGDLKGPDLNMSSKFDADFTAPDLGIDGPKADVKGITLPNVHLPSGKTRTSKFRLPDIGLSGPKVKAPDVDLSFPKMGGELKPPKLTVPDLDIDVPSGKIKGLPRAPDFNINTPSGKLKMPNVKEPNLKGEIGSPDMNLAFPKTDLKGTKLDRKPLDIDIDSPTGKLKMPKMKTPKIGISGFKGPDIDFEGDLEETDFSMPSPRFGADITGYDLDIDGPKAKVRDMALPNVKLSSTETKNDKLKFPDIGLSGTKIKAPDMDLSLPKMKGDLNSPKLSVPDLDIDVPSGKIKGPGLNEPNIDIRSPDFNINASSGKLKMPNLKGPNLKGEMGSPNMNLAFPEANVKGPKLDRKPLDIDIDSPTGKLKMPKIKTPKDGISGFKGLDIDFKGDLEETDFSMPSPRFGADNTGTRFVIDGPKANVKPKAPALPKLKEPKLTSPEFDVSIPTGKIKGPTLEEPKIRTPDFKIDSLSGKRTITTFKSPKVKGDMSSPYLNLDFPEADIPQGSLQMRSPKKDFVSPIIDIDSPAGKLKTDKTQTLRNSIPGFKEGDSDYKGIRERPGLSLSSLKPDYVHTPEIDINGLKTSSSSSHYNHKSDMEYHRGRDTNGSMKFTNGLESLVSDLEFEVPKQSLKGSKFKVLTLV